MNFKANTIQWHDAFILDIKIDRRNAGHNDTIELLLKFDDGRCRILRFIACYFANFSLNFGVVADETIRDFSVLTDGVELDKLQRRVASFGDVAEKLSLYRIETNSTGSVLDIFAISFELIEQA